MTATAEATRIVTFRLGADLFAADILTVERVLRYETPRGIPNVPSWIEGVIEYQGDVVPVIDLRRRFELPEAPLNGQTRMLVLGKAGDWIAVIVDAVLDVRPIDERDIAPPPPLFRGLAGEYLRGVVRRDDVLVVVLDVEKLLSSTERLALDDASDAPAVDG